MPNTPLNSALGGITMYEWSRFSVLIVLLSVAVPGMAVEQAMECPKTIGSSNLLGKPFPSADSWYGSETLAVILPTNGVWTGMGPERNYGDKLFWWSRGYDGHVEPEPELEVTGRRLDAESPAAQISTANGAHADSLGGWTMLVGVEFPVAGCWEITGKYLGQELSFVVEVRAAT